MPELILLSYMESPITSSISVNSLQNMTSSDKAIGIKNNTNNSVSLNNVTVKVERNDDSIVTYNLSDNYTGDLAPGQTCLIYRNKNDQTNTEFVNQITNHVLSSRHILIGINSSVVQYISGDDKVILLKAGVEIDWLGKKNYNWGRNLLSVRKLDPINYYSDSAAADAAAEGGGFRGGGGYAWNRITNNDGGTNDDWSMLNWTTLVSYLLTGTPDAEATNTIFPICFAKGTIISTDQGNVEIQNIVPGKHTICKKAICHITKTISPEKKIVCVKKNAFGKNKPNKAITMSGNHCIQCEKGAMVKAKKLVANNPKMKFVEYNQEPLYNVLMEDHNVIKVQNLEVETLDPKNIVAKIYNSLMDKSILAKLVKQMNEGILENNREKYLIAEYEIKKTY